MGWHLYGEISLQSDHSPRTGVHFTKKHAKNLFKVSSDGKCKMRCVYGSQNHSVEIVRFYSLEKSLKSINGFIFKVIVKMVTFTEFFFVKNMVRVKFFNFHTVQNLQMQWQTTCYKRWLWQCGDQPCRQRRCQLETILRKAWQRTVDSPFQKIDFGFSFFGL